MKQGRELFEDCSRWLAETYPVCARGLLAAAPEDEREELLPTAIETLEGYAALAGGSRERLERGLEGFAEVCFEFLRLQARFRKTGRYEATEAGAEPLARELYLDAEEMRGGYLDGLHLSYVFWPNHVRRLRFFREEFLDHLSPGSRVLEVGGGHGAMTLVALRHPGNFEVLSLDLSPHAHEHARELLVANGVDLARVTFEVGDVTRAPTAPRPAADAVVCCEVLEHVDDPPALLRGLRARLAPGGRAFLSTVANIEFRGHVALFDDADHIRRLISGAGFRVERDLPRVLPGFEGDARIPLNYAARVTRDDGRATGRESRP